MRHVNISRETVHVHRFTIGSRELHVTVRPASETKIPFVESLSLDMTPIHKDGSIIRDPKLYRMHFGTDRKTGRERWWEQTSRIGGKDLDYAKNDLRTLIAYLDANTIEPHANIIREAAQLALDRVSNRVFHMTAIDNDEKPHE